MDLPDSLKFVIVHCGTNNVFKDGPVDRNALFLIATHAQKKKAWYKNNCVSSTTKRPISIKNPLYHRFNKQRARSMLQKQKYSEHSLFVARIYVDKPKWITECQPLLRRLSSLVMEMNRETLETSHRNHQRT